jgi:hypothetical protein
MLNCQQQDQLKKEYVKAVNEYGRAASQAQRMKSTDPKPRVI